MVKRLICVLSLVLAAVGCSNKLSGSVTVNGEPFAIESCRNGVIHGFRGVELVDKTGMRLRVAALPSGEARVFVIPAGANVGKELAGACGELVIEDQNSTINDVKNVKGTATLACALDGFEIKGKVTFENCH
jgi:hypothetical protein